MINKSEIRMAILQSLTGQDGKLPGIQEISAAVAVDQKIVHEQLEIMESLGLVRPNFTMDGGAWPQITGIGRLELESDVVPIISASGSSTENPVPEPTLNANANVKWDAFISHASDDKKTFARPLADALGSRIRVWFDERTLKVGDSLRRSIDEGLAGSKYGIVVLSRAFFAKEWTQKELDGLVALGSKILPVWLDVSYEDVKRYSPTLADKIAVRASDGFEAVVTQLLTVITDETYAPGSLGLSNEHVPALSSIEVIGAQSQIAPTEIELLIGGNKSREPDMSISVNINHIYGPPVVPLQIDVWSVLVDGKTELYETAYLQPDDDLSSVVSVQKVDENARSLRPVGWPYEERPDDLWVAFKYRDLGGKTHQVARIFGLSKPSNQNELVI